MTPNIGERSREAPDPHELDLVSTLAWTAPVQIEHHGWIYRSARGFTRRANSATPVSPEAAAVDPNVIVRWIRATAESRSEVARVQLSDTDQWSAMATALAGLGAAPQATTSVMFAPPAVLPPASVDVTVAAAVSDTWFECWQSVSGGRAATPVEREFFSRLAPVSAASVLRDGVAVAVGLGLPTDHGLYIAAMATRPEHRGQGHATEILRALRRANPGRAVLDVDPANPAVHMYRAEGFVHSHHYSYYELP